MSIMLNDTNNVIMLSSDDAESHTGIRQQSPCSLVH